MKAARCTWESDGRYCGCCLPAQHPDPHCTHPARQLVVRMGQAAEPGVLRLRGGALVTCSAASVLADE